MCLLLMVLNWKAEALAVREGLEFVNRRRWQTIEVESDSQILIKSILGEFSVFLEIDLIVEDIRNQGRLLDPTFPYVRRSLNNAAHTIAHWNCGPENEAFWLDSRPHWLMSTLLSDCNS
ncbi:hypothetical protein LIER_41834 [Lithospermum erythrorhizon]|uniref:RNase H type-1 domain-containing protein n=1 Tax=Lithospermum erythrorhizon TaxID=34254 RepID=A0AAV3RF53_LITER